MAKPRYIFGCKQLTGSKISNWSNYSHPNCRQFRCPCNWDSICEDYVVKGCVINDAFMACVDCNNESCNKDQAYPKFDDPDLEGITSTDDDIIPVWFKK